MSKYLVDSTQMTDIADAIRQKDGTQTTMTVDEMPTRIQNIPGGGGTDYLAVDIDGTTTSYSYTIPDTVTRIRAGAFMYSNISSVTIPDTVTRIGGAAFQGCTKLTNVVLPHSIEYGIGDYTFESCTYLQSVTLPSNISIGAKVIGSHAFYNCRRLTTVINISAWVEFGENAFHGTALVGDINIGNDALFDSYCFWNSQSSGILFIHFSSENPSWSYTMRGVSCFSTDHCRLVVPYSADHSILTAYQTAFPDYSSIMLEEIP